MTYPRSPVFDAGAHTSNVQTRNDATGRLLNRWIRLPFDYRWSRAHAHARGRATFERRVASALCLLLFGVGAALCLGRVHEGPKWCAVVIGAAAIGFAGYAAAWLRPIWPHERRSQIFLAFTDAAVCVYIVGSPQGDATGLATLLIVPGMYVLFVHGPRTLLVHLVLAATVTMTVAVLDQRSGTVGLETTVIAGAVCAGTVTTFILAHIALSELRHDAWLSFVDPLTGALNRRGMFEAVARLPAVSAPKTDLIVILVDLDNFKRWNDNRGHAAGDRFLMDVVNIMSVQYGQSFMIVRIGGEEFAVIGPGDVGGAFQLSDKLRNQIGLASCGEVTASIGVVELCTDGLPFPLDPQVVIEAIDHADQAMYSAKFSGGDRTRIWRGN